MCIFQEAHAAEILSKDLELTEVQLRLARVINEKDGEIKQLASQFQVSITSH